jgi:hypothetical protein
VFSCSKIEQKQLNTWASFQSAEQPLLGQFSVSDNTLNLLRKTQISISDAYFSAVETEADFFNTIGRFRPFATGCNQPKAALIPLDTAP